MSVSIYPGNLNPDCYVCTLIEPVDVRDTKNNTRNKQAVVLNKINVSGTST